MSILDLEVLPYVEVITQEHYNYHKILCIRVERWWSDGTPFDVTKMGFISLNRVDHKIKPKIGNELIKEHFKKADTEPKVEYFGQLEQSAWFNGTVIGFECEENVESDQVVKLTKKLCNQLVDFENVVVDYRKELES